MKDIEVRMPLVGSEVSGVLEIDGVRKMECEPATMTEWTAYLTDSKDFFSSNHSTQTEKVCGTHERMKL